MQFKLENIQGTSNVELTFKVDYKKALELIAFAKGELKIMPDEYEEWRYKNEFGNDRTEFPLQQYSRVFQ